MEELMGKPGVNSPPPWCSVIISLLHTPTTTTTNAYFANATSRINTATILPTLLIMRRAASARW